MSGTFDQLSSVELRSIAGAIRGRRLDCRPTALSLQAHVVARYAEPLAEELAALRSDEETLASLLDLLATERERRESRDRSIEIVWTGPAVPNDTARETGAVVRELFSAARRTVLIVGYVVYDGRELFKLLAARLDAEPSLQVTFVLDVGRRYGVTTTEGEIVAGFAAEFRATKWPGTRLPSVYYDPRSLALEPRERSSMHAKCIVIDSTAALVTSANFTHAAQEKNVEVGLRVDDPVIAAGVAGRFEYLIRNGSLRELRFDGLSAG